jgi:hypothetical protein
MMPNLTDEQLRKIRGGLMAAMLDPISIAGVDAALRAAYDLGWKARGERDSKLLMKRADALDSMKKYSDSAEVQHCIGIILREDEE